MTNEFYRITDPYELAKYIKDAKKVTPVKVYLSGKLSDAPFPDGKKFGTDDFWILIGEYQDTKRYIEQNQDLIKDCYIESDRRNSAIPMLDIKDLDARIEPGALIREGVKIGKKAVIMMGAVVNIGSEIGDGSMIDMNAVLGARVIIGKNVHVGAGAVLAGVLEPPSATPVVIEDHVLIGANSVILEGITVGAGSVIAAGSVVTRNIPGGCVAAGSPARIIKVKDEKTIEKTKLLEDLREIKSE
ncbi:2,3,4,5-tetrahydropyridine-2,6-dicarboxylate N-acetyltransferase [Sinanaerobacter chloroacetimidivorans]|uniref:2,3,4,5-tetrahydropyridine-2,6-dicarboxylate N-acetyltransferase n=1 Tax=Sinanaerobacter chloroacetimidivorans TaxID=2818044 RepID=A0A8J7VXG1_9FIRM|nr:2,3,4,5-tetrahydropyridine-2,6-dicarboxylate N-acetyltransferase [Sinanaerobacter chloroacetimidivorans]MBR0596539.1 2,3,4,5-tetrahydropyridine-2,6-dicarboxylate N-acetyltransferase [Sinanaerobacter chloroacetimidivorans]